MTFCNDHWQRLRKEIDERGLGGLVAGSGEKATRKIATELEQGAQSRETFDPLMGAFFAISGNIMDKLGQAGMNPLYLLASDAPEDPVVGYPGYEGRTWSRCVLCYINLAHEVSCKDARCRLPKQGGYDWMLARAADDALAKAREYKLVPPPS